MSQQSSKWMQGLKFAEAEVAKSGAFAAVERNGRQWNE